ncbi:family 78 glycoside hydrolase catalytic domain [Nonomuraea sp. CA-141351]|uniref:family 78 glycoside hydrolase catalytic domain n=1 Tax=Nonomuraea sp. CA-141351 TaxID=3239996 RepID=UPI003D9145C2
MNTPSRLRVDHLGETLGTDVARPCLSWWLPAGSTHQLAYRIRTQDWDSGRIESDRSLLVPYVGPEPAAGQRVTWQVKVWTDLGESGWSATSFWERTIGAWTARWIEPAEDSTPEPGRRPAYLLRHEFTLDAVPARARLYATAHGVYEVFVNGVRVGDQEVTPGFTAYHSRLHVQTYDVGAQLRAGSNVIGAVLSDGWYRGRTGYERIPDGYGTRTAFLAELHAGDTVIGTGPDWRSTTGEIVAADLMDGQESDFSRAIPGWSRPGLDVSAWQKVRLPDLTAEGRLTTSPAPPVRRIETLTPVAITSPRPRVQVVDFGQTISGWVRLSAPPGQVTLTHGEALGPDGDLTMDHLAAVDHATGTKLDTGQQDRVTAAGGEVFEPRHTTHGFRYVRVEGHDGPPDVEAVVVHTDLRRTGWFTCSDERINRLHEAAVWSFRGNACDIPTDCPTRERAGFTGDWQIFLPTAAFLYDVAGFSIKWLRDLAADQWPDGRVPNWAPEPGRDRRADETYTYMNGSAGWGDAAAIVPWQTYLAYADERILAEQYASMTRWVDFAATRAREGRHPERAAARPQPAPHEEYLWDTGFHWGEWTEPQQDQPFWAIDQGIVATAYLHLSAKLLARTAAVLGKDTDEARYAAYADNVLAAWRAEFIRADDTLTVDTQATHVRALAFGLVPPRLRKQTALRLVELIRAAGTHLGTGFLATPFLLPVLADTGHLDVAYELLFQDSVPSWLAMIDRGATTIWEDWDAIADDGTPKSSQNHYSKGAVISFLHRYTAGIRPRDDAPGYRHFDIHPQPGGGLTSAEAQLDCPYGGITSRWRIDDGTFHLTATVPPGTRATLTLPDGTTVDVGPGLHQHTCPAT